MPLRPVVLCGYVDILVNLNCDGVDEVRNYNKEVGQIYPELKVDEGNWKKNRKSQQEALKRKFVLY